jgi:hypothetical protein
MILCNREEKRLKNEFTAVFPPCGYSRYIIVYMYTYLLVMCVYIHGDPFIHVMLLIFNLI